MKQKPGSPASRPSIPLRVRLLVIERQLLKVGIAPLSPYYGFPAKKRKLSDRLAFNLHELFGKRKVELHHRHALVNRRKCNGYYDPPANDPFYLVYLSKDDHDIETRVRGQHGQYSDLGLARKRKRMDENRGRRKRKPKVKIPQRVDPWAKSRKLRGRSHD